MLPLGNSSDSSFANLWKCILAHIKLSSWTSDRYISSLLKFICMKIYLQWDMFMNLGSFWDETLHCILNLHKIVLTTVFLIWFQWVNIPWAEHYCLGSVKCYSAFAYYVLQHTWVVLKFIRFCPTYLYGASMDSLSRHRNVCILYFYRIWELFTEV